MSLKLSHSSDASHTITAKTWTADHVMLFSKELSSSHGIEIDMRDFCELVLYVLTNTDLDPMDPRVRLVNLIREMKIVEGHNGEGTGRFACVQGCAVDAEEGHVRG